MISTFSIKAQNFFCVFYFEFRFVILCYVQKQTSKDFETMDIAACV